MLVYLAGPMSGIIDMNFPAFNQAAADLRLHGYDVINPAETAGGDPDLTRAVVMRIDFHYILNVDGIVMLPDWETSNGAVVEALVARELGLKLYEYRGRGTRLRQIKVDVTVTSETARAMAHV